MVRWDLLPVVCWIAMNVECHSIMKRVVGLPLESTCVVVVMVWCCCAAAAVAQWGFDARPPPAGDYERLRADTAGDDEMEDWSGEHMDADIDGQLGRAQGADNWVPEWRAGRQVRWLLDAVGSGLLICGVGRCGIGVLHSVDAAVLVLVGLGRKWRAPNVRDGNGSFVWVAAAGAIVAGACRVSIAAVKEWDNGPETALLCIGWPLYSVARGMFPGEGHPHGVLTRFSARPRRRRHLGMGARISSDDDVSHWQNIMACLVVSCIPTIAVILLLLSGSLPDGVMVQLARVAILAGGTALTEPHTMVGGHVHRNDGVQETDTIVDADPTLVECAGRAGLIWVGLSGQHAVAVWPLPCTMFGVCAWLLSAKTHDCPREEGPFRRWSWLMLWGGVVAAVAMTEVACMLRHDVRRTSAVSGPRITLQLSASPYDGHEFREWADCLVALRARIREVAAPLVRGASGSGSHVVYVNVAEHLNIGDTTIALGTEHFFRDMDVQVHARFSSKMTVNQIAPNITNTSIIVCHGGGNLGDLWRSHQQFRLELIQHFPHNRIVIMPQTIWFEEQGNVDATAAVFSKHPDLHILARDAHSVTFCGKYFQDNHCHFCPDMAFYLGRLVMPTSPAQPALFLRRRDKERRDKTDLAVPWMKEDDWLNYPAIPSQFLAGEDERSMDLPTYQLRRLELGLAILSRGRLVMSDRLHAALLCFLGGVPHVVVDSRYKKTRMVMEAVSTVCGAQHERPFRNPLTHFAADIQGGLVHASMLLPTARRFYADAFLLVCEEDPKLAMAQERVTGNTHDALQTGSVIVSRLPDSMPPSLEFMWVLHADGTVMGLQSMLTLETAEDCTEGRIFSRLRTEDGNLNKRLLGQRFHLDTDQRLFSIYCRGVVSAEETNVGAHFVTLAVATQPAVGKWLVSPIKLLADK